VLLDHRVKKILEAKAKNLEACNKGAEVKIVQRGHNQDRQEEVGANLIEDHGVQVEDVQDLIQEEEIDKDEAGVGDLVQDHIGVIVEIGEEVEVTGEEVEVIGGEVLAEEDREIDLEMTDREDQLVQ
jgi:hypothetical protein